MSLPPLMPIGLAGVVIGDALNAGQLYQRCRYSQLLEHREIGRPQVHI